MDQDNPNMNDSQRDMMEWWEGVRREEMAKAEKMDAEQRMRHTSMLEDFGAEVEAGKDWVAADWEQFKGRVQQWRNRGEVAADEII
jgi:hypothetical protein